MTRRAKWTIGIASAGIAAAVLFLLLRPAGNDNAMGQRANAFLDNLLAVGLRIADLPVFMLLAMVGLLAALMTALVERFARRRIRPLRVTLVTAGILALFGLAFVADRKASRLQNEIDALRRELSAQRMANTQFASETPAPAAAVPQASADPAPRAASATRGAAPVIAASSAPAAAQTPAVSAATSTAAAPRTKLMIDPEQIKKTLASTFSGITMQALVHDRATDVVELHAENPTIVAYVSITDLRTPGLELKLDAPNSLDHKTFTSDFAKKYDCSIAINGEAGQSPMANSGLGNWRGNFISAGNVLLKEVAGNPRPFLSFTRDNVPSFKAQMAKDRALFADGYNVIWGRMDAVVDGTVQTAAERDRQPRTGMGISSDGSRLILLVVDGRQPRWSVGFTRAEVGTCLAAFGATNGMLCDEGGSSCIYMKKFRGIVNSPSDGEERATYTHFGIILHTP